MTSKAECEPQELETAQAGWRTQGTNHSLSEVHGSIAVPVGTGFWRRLLAFSGPGYLVAVGYMDPGNWATDIQGGAAYGYLLLSVVLISNFLAIFLQALSAKLGIVTNRDLAQACRDAYPRPVSMVLWLSAEIAIVACDIAEVVGAAIALNLLFHIPLTLGVVLTALDVLLVLALQHKGFRWIEILVITLIASMAVIFFIEILYSHPAWIPLLRGFVPGPQIVRDPAMLYIALGILGATVMPHNLYLHSAIIQTRDYDRSFAGLKSAIRCAYIDSTGALSVAFLVNAAILIVAAAAFHYSGHQDVANIQDAYKLLTPLLGVAVATPLFAIALLASGQNSTLTGTLAGQIILEGFVHVRLQPWLRRMISRLLAIVPAIGAVALYGEKGLGSLIIFSQVVLSAQLSCAVVPLVQFTSDPDKMGAFVNGAATKCLGYFVALLIFVLNAYLVFVTIFPGQAGR